MVPQLRSSMNEMVHVLIKGSRLQRLYLHLMKVVNIESLKNCVILSCANKQRKNNKEVSEKIDVFSENDKK